MAFIKLRDAVEDDYSIGVHNMGGTRVELKKGMIVEVKETDLKSYLLGFGSTIEQTFEKPTEEEVDEEEEETEYVLPEYKKITGDKIKEKLIELEVDFGDEEEKKNLYALLEATLLGENESEEEVDEEEEETDEDEVEDIEE